LYSVTLVLARGGTLFNNYQEINLIQWHAHYVGSSVHYSVRLST